jgi:hypothetical protein
LLIGSWKNIEELESSLNLEELEAVVKAARDREHRTNKFLAALKGIDIDKDSQSSAQERVEELKRKVELQRLGAKKVEKKELMDFGIDVVEE